MIVALERPNSGSVLLAGRDISALSGGELRRNRNELAADVPGPVLLA